MATAEQYNAGMDRYNRYYQTMLGQLQQSQGPERSDSQIKNYLVRMIKPTYDAAIRSRQQQTGQAKAAIDADAASRGMGTSTWVTDAKNRQMTNEAADVATLNSNYGSALYEALLNQINQRDQNRLNLMSMAQGITGNMYDRWKNEEGAAGSGGGGGDTGTGSRKKKAPTATDPGYGLEANSLVTMDSPNDLTKKKKTTGIGARGANM